MSEDAARIAAAERDWWALRDDHLLGQLDDLESLYRDGLLPAVLMANDLCAHARIPQPDWLATANRELLISALKGEHLAGHVMGRTGSPYVRWRQDMTHLRRYICCRQLLTLHGKEDGGPVRHTNLFRIAAFKARCLIRNQPFDIQTAAEESEADPATEFEVKFRKSYFLVRRALRDPARAARFHYPIFERALSRDLWPPMTSPEYFN